MGTQGAQHQKHPTSPTDRKDKIHGKTTKLKRIGGECSGTLTYSLPAGNHNHLRQETHHVYSQDFRNQCDVDQEFRGRDPLRDYARGKDATERQKRLDQGRARRRRERTSVRVPGEHDGDVRARRLDCIGRLPRSAFDQRPSPYIEEPVPHIGAPGSGLGCSPHRHWGQPPLAIRTHGFRRRRQTRKSALQSPRGPPRLIPHVRSGE